MNYARTALLLAAMTGLFLAVGYLIGGQGGGGPDRGGDVPAADELGFRHERGVGDR